MIPTITNVVGQFKRDWTRQLEDEAVERACREANHTWRSGLLNPAATVQLFLLQVLHGNTACAHLRHLAGVSFTAAAYCQARSRLPLAVFQILLRRVVRRLQEESSDEGRWRGHRTFFVDGSSFSMPDAPALRDHFGQPGGQREGCGFPTAHLLALFHAGTGALLEVLAAPLRTHDMSGAAELHPSLRRGDVLAADRGFCGYAHLALLLQRGVHAVMRLHQRQIVDFTPGRPHVVPGRGKAQTKKGLPRSRWIKKLGATDQIVAWLKPAKRPKWMSVEQFAALPEQLLVRELRYRVATPGFRAKEVTLAATLLDAELYPPEALADLYRARWRIETNFAHLKTTMGLDALKCKTVEGVLKELIVFALVYNLARQVTLEASRRGGVAVERISFIDALRWLAAAADGRPLGPLVVNPDRPDRYEPRVRKRRPKQYSLMQKPRAQLRKTLADQEDAP